MKTRRTALVALVAAAGLAMAGCSADPMPEPPAAESTPPAVDSTPTESSPMDAMPESFEQGDFYFVSADNVVGKFTIPGDPVPRLESLRKGAKAGPVSYLSVKLDARDATDGANMYALTMFDPDGKKYEFQSAESTISDWMDLVDTDDTDLYNRFVDASNAEPYHVEAAEVGTIVMTSKENVLPKEITRIAVSPLGAFDETEAYPVSMGQGLNLDF